MLLSQSMRNSWGVMPMASWNLRLGTSGDAPCGLCLQLVHRTKYAQVVEIVVECLVERGASEELYDACLGRADEICQLFESEIGVGEVLACLEFGLDDGHEFVVVAQVGMLDQFLVTYDQFFHHLYTTADVIIGIDHLTELHVAVHEFQVVFPERFDF